MIYNDTYISMNSNYSDLLLFFQSLNTLIFIMAGTFR